MAWEGQSNVNKKLVPTTLAAAVTIALALGSFAIKLRADDDGHDHDSSHFSTFVPGTIVISRTVYEGTADTVTIGESLPPGCQPATVQDPPAPPIQQTETVVLPIVPATNPPTTTAVTTQPFCGYASDNGEAPNLSDSHNVWNNAATDGSFGISSPIYLDDLTTDGQKLGTLRVPSNEIVTSFSSKSELALNRSVDGKSLTFMGYRGGPACPALTSTITGTFPNLTYTITQAAKSSGMISPTAPNLIDVSASNTPGLCDPTNTAVDSYVGATFPTAYYRSVAEVDPWGRISYTDNNVYSGDNSRASIKADNWLYYSVGNDNSGNLGKKQVPITQLGIDLSHSTGAELIVPGQTPPIPPNNDMLGFFIISGDKPGKDTNFRGMTIFNDTLYVTKGSGGNGVNTVYQVGNTDVLPTPSNAPAGGLINEPITALPGFPQIAPVPDTSTTAGTASAGGYYPFGIWFANATTLYVCNEGDLSYTANQVINGQVNVANPGDLAPGTMFSAGLQKWFLQNGTWVLQYVIQDGLNLGVPYSVPNYPASIEPATGGCRNIIGVVNRGGTATIYAITSTISQNGDNGADPDKLVKVTDAISATKLATGGELDTFVTLRTARAGETFRGVALAPEEDGDR
jgi:hypothetical protein